MSDQSDRKRSNKKRKSNKTTDEHTHKRSRNEESRKTFYSRLDALARVLEGASPCTALTSVHDANGNKKIWIASNNLFCRSQKTNKDIEQITAVMKYFKELSQGINKSKENRITLLEKIFGQHCKSSAKGTISVPDFVINSVVNLVVNRQDNSLTFNLKDVDNKHIEAAGLTLASFGRFYQDFCKLEKSAMVDGELNDFFQQDYEILTGAESKGVHAEMQLLDKLIQEEIYKNKGNDQVYFAISKLCCFHCNELLEATNEVFKNKTNKINILFAGTHGLITRNWEAPSFFKNPEHTGTKVRNHSDSKDVASKASHQELKVQEEVQKNATERIKEKSKWGKNPGVVYMARTVSEPITNKTKEFNTIRIELESMMQNIKKIEQLSGGKSCQFLSSGLNVIHLDSYKTLLLEDNPQGINLNEHINLMFAESQKKEDCFESRSELLKFLCMQGFLPDTVIDKLKPLLDAKEQKLVAFNVSSDRDSATNKNTSLLQEQNKPSESVSSELESLKSNEKFANPNGGEDNKVEDNKMELDPDGNHISRPGMG